jgi:ubiquinone/menaquinone biosynthesis C-methylase UbiE
MPINRAATSRPRLRNMARVPVSLVCPQCKGKLTSRLGGPLCGSCGARYVLKDRIAILAPDMLSVQHRFQQRYFDAEFSDYTGYELENWRLSYIERIFAALGVLGGGEPYLDVGVGGSGATVIEAARRGVEAVGCDLSFAGIVAAKRNAQQQGIHDLAQFVVCAAEHLPFPDGAFGSASAVAVLEHLEDDRPAAVELARVLRPGGLMWVTVPHAYRYMPPPVWPLYLCHDLRIGHKRHYDEERLTRLFAHVGMERVRTLYSGHPVKILQLVVSLLHPRWRQSRSRLWWRLEQADRRAERRAWGALQLNAVFRRPR